jgi:metal-dependent amidase/aminoacylase/carboxypeptidase family protein
MLLGGCFYAQVALRADTDALPMTEGNHHLPYRSRHEGSAHMCGHDGHVAALVAAAALITARLDRIPKVRVFLISKKAEK